MGSPPCIAWVSSIATSSRTKFLQGGGKLSRFDLGVVRVPGWEDFPPEDIPGTPAYMAPEMFKGEAGSEATDIYALGVTMFRAFTGEFPYGNGGQEVKGARDIQNDPVAKEQRPWNAGRNWRQWALKAQQVWAIRFWLDRERWLRDRAMFDLAIDSKLRGCDIVKIKIGDLVSGGRVRSSHRNSTENRPPRSVRAP